MWVQGWSAATLLPLLPLGEGWDEGGRSIVLSGSACLRFFAAEQTAKIVGDIKQYRHQKQGHTGSKQNTKAH